MRKPVWLRVAQILGMVWTSPNTVIGIVAGLVGMLFGAAVHWHRRECALIFCRMPFFRIAGVAAGALTLGNVILYTGNDLDVPCHTYAHRAGYAVELPVMLADHERAHVYQYMALGPLFLPIYLLCGGVSARNPFERAADRYAQSGRGWWPWK
ncbi:MAG: hypothetical protein WA777_17750 [Rhodanobacter sp.]